MVVPWNEREIEKRLDSHVLLRILVIEGLEDVMDSLHLVCWLSNHFQSVVSVGAIHSLVFEHLLHFLQSLPRVGVALKFFHLHVVIINVKQLLVSQGVEVVGQLVLEIKVLLELLTLPIENESNRVEDRDCNERCDTDRLKA